ncbi:MerR family transcriptional regulator [Candidatus Magnetomorum sp. HK-1]|nr:MerR family transcriptional regulator [Candidatus Magnetomorum sp. HK-1]
MDLKEKENYSIEDLTNITGMNKRNIRYYIQKGIIDNPFGQGKGAYYTNNHIKQLNETIKWKKVGLPLERIQSIVRGLVSGDKKHVPDLPSNIIAENELWNRLIIENGIELNISTTRSPFNLEECIEIQKRIIKLIDDFKEEKNKMRS